MLQKPFGNPSDFLERSLNLTPSGNALESAVARFGTELLSPAALCADDAFPAQGVELTQSPALPLSPTYQFLFLACPGLP